MKLEESLHSSNSTMLLNEINKSSFHWNVRKNYMASSYHYVVQWNMKLQLSERLSKIILMSAECEVRGGCDESRGGEIKELLPLSSSLMDNLLSFA